MSSVELSIDLDAIKRLAKTSEIFGIALSVVILLVALLCALGEKK